MPNLVQFPWPIMIWQWGDGTYETPNTYFDNGKQYIDTVEQAMSTRTFVFAVMLSFQRGV